MLRSFLIYLSKAEWMKRIVTHWGIARRVVTRFVAGENLDDAIAVIGELNQKGLYVTLYQLGEDTVTEADARNTGKEILDVLDAIHNAGVISSVSLKLTQVGLALDEMLCIEIVTNILERAKTYDNFVRIDMEDSSCVDATIRVFYALRDKGFDNVGMVMQSYLYRAEEDTKKLLADFCPIRMVKGAYKEPPEVAYPQKADVDENFDRLMALMIDSEIQKLDRVAGKDGRWPPIPAAGTHDEDRIAFAKQYAAKVGLPKGHVEIQMLYGIRRDLQEKLVGEGYPVRIYVPFGTQWYPYLMRRLAERPANLWFFISTIFKR